MQRFRGPFRPPAAAPKDPPSAIRMTSRSPPHKLSKIGRVRASPPAPASQPKHMKASQLVTIFHKIPPTTTPRPARTPISCRACDSSRSSLLTPHLCPHPGFGMHLGRGPGQSPLTWFASGAEVSQRIHEGHFRGTDIEPTRGQAQGLPLPDLAEGYRQGPALPAFVQGAGLVSSGTHSPDCAFSRRGPIFLQEILRV